MLDSPLNRRSFIALCAAAAALPLLLHFRAAAAEAFEIVKTDGEWKDQLSPAAYQVLRHDGTEPPGSSPLDHNYADGVYNCAGCDLPLFSSSAKFDSHTGWPSFFQPLPNAVATRDDTTMMMTRIEVHCRRCGGHLGHVFDDGPAPTGKRYCMNGVALKFIPAQK